MTSITPQNPATPGAASGRSEDSRTREALGQAGQRLSDDVRQLADAGERAASAGLEKVYQGAAVAKRSVEQGMSAASEMGEDWMCTLRKTVEAHPILSIATAIGVGIVLDRLFAGSRR